MNNLIFASCELYKLSYLLYLTGVNVNNINCVTLLAQYALSYFLEEIGSIKSSMSVEKIDDIYIC